MGQYIQNINGKIKTSSTDLVLYLFKIISGLVLGLTFSLIGDEIIGYGKFSFIFVTVLTIGGFLRTARGWSFVGVIVFDFICVLIGMLLRMYILVAPGA